MWSKSGRELFYTLVDPSRLRLMRVAVRPAGPGGAFAYDPPEEILNLSGFKAGSVGRSWDISPDDKRFLMVRSVRLTSSAAHLMFQSASSARYGLSSAMAAPSSALQEVYGCPNYRGAFEDNPDVDRAADQAAEVGPGSEKAI